ncbi:MAG TPA: SRPBCC family protein [Albitalea sp.]
MSTAMRFERVSRWHLAAPVETVWNAIKAADGWPGWWRYVRSVRELSPGDAEGLGAVRRIAWSSRLPYGIDFDVVITEAERPRRLAGRASGAIEGVGTWELVPEGATTRVTYTWSVELARPWMRLLAPIATPVFRWNHDAVMRAGAQGLARHLGVRLLEAR